MGLIKGMQTENVSRLSLRKAITVAPAVTVRKCVEQMRQGQLGCVIVVDDAQNPLGTFTEAMLRHLLVDSPGKLDAPVESVMSRTSPQVSTSDSISRVLDAMEQSNTRFVVVVDGDGKVGGLTGQKGLMEYIAEYYPGEVMVQRVGTKPFSVKREGA